MNTAYPKSFDEIPYDEVSQHEDYIGGYTETTDYEFLSDSELESLEKEVWGWNPSNRPSTI